jgi:hypothetical protein
MPLIPPASARGRYIVHATDPARLAAFLDGLRKDAPGVEVVDRIGPDGQAHTAVLAVSADQAGALEQRIRSTDQLTIEPDRPLSPLSPP